MNEKKLDKITKYVAINLACAVATFIAVVAAVALFGPHIAPLMNKLPW